MRIVRRAGGDRPKRKAAIVEALIGRGHSARSACRIVGLNRSTWGFHRRRPMSTRALRRTEVADAIGKIHQRSRGVYGKRRIRAALLEDHEMISR